MQVCKWGTEKASVSKSFTMKKFVQLEKYFEISIIKILSREIGNRTTHLLEGLGPLLLLEDKQKMLSVRTCVCPNHLNFSQI